MADYAIARDMMVEGQIRTFDVTDLDILAAFSAVPRERFVPERLRPLAYVDRDLRITERGSEQAARYLMNAGAFARLIQLAEISPGDKVMLVGDPTGYGAAILARLAKSVAAVESDAALADAARRALAAAGTANASVLTGPLAAGDPAGAPFGVIVLAGAVEVVPDALVAQLNEGGRLVAIVGSGLAAAATVMIRTGGELSRRPAFNAAVEPLPGFSRPKSFVF